MLVWVGDRTAPLATGKLPDDVHTLPAPPGVPVLREVTNPWEAIAAAPDRLLRLPPPRPPA